MGQQLDCAYCYFKVVGAKNVTHTHMAQEAAKKKKNINGSRAHTSVNSANLQSISADFAALFLAQKRDIFPAHKM